MIVIYDKTNQLIIPTKSFKGKKGGTGRAGTWPSGLVRLIPGVNEISEAQWEAIKTIKDVKAYVEAGVIKLVGAAKVGTPEEAKIEEKEKDGPKAPGTLGALVDLSAYGPKDAMELVNNVMDAEQLKRWRAIEADAKNPRKAVMEALNAQITRIEKVDATAKPMGNKGGDN